MAVPLHRVVVLGGGILGVSTALHLLRGGASVVLVTEAGLGSGASGRSLSWLNSAGERSEDYHLLRMAGIDRYRTLFASDPARGWLRFDGGLRWSGDGNEEATRQRSDHERRHGYDSRLVGPGEVRAVAPGVDPGAVAPAAVFNPGEGWVSLPHLIEFLMEEFQRLGGALVTSAGKCAVVLSGGRATGVRTGTGLRYDGEAVVVACGAQTPQVAAELGVTLDDASPLSMLVVTRPVDTGLRSVLNSPRAAVRPNPGGTLAVDHDWYADAIEQNPDGTFTVPEPVVRELLREASALIEGNPRLEPATVKIGRKPIPGDGAPVFGELDRVPGCFVAFTHSGATLGLIAGELLAGEILTGDKHPMLAGFRPERFADRHLGQDQDRRG